MLEQLRADFPEVVLENCASGGLRIDLGILRRTDFTFLSDPDYPVHSLQVFWGATTMLAPDSCLHWSYSQWGPGNGTSHQNFNPHDPNLQPHQFDYYTRISMLGVCGFSQKLPELPGWVRQRLTDHIRIYKEHVRRFVRAATLYRLTEQPRRTGEGERWCAFQYSLPDEHLLFVFRLPGAEAERAIRLKDLQPDGLYRIAGFEGEQHPPMTGRDLMERGIIFSALREEESALLLVF
jgi:alpha-galactosidase